MPGGQGACEELAARSKAVEVSDALPSQSITCQKTLADATAVHVSPNLLLPALQRRRHAVRVFAHRQEQAGTACQPHHHSTRAAVHILHLLKSSSSVNNTIDSMQSSRWACCSSQKPAGALTLR